MMEDYQSWRSRSRGGRRQKRSNSSMSRGDGGDGTSATQHQNQNNKIRCTTFRFDVDIPNHYNNTVDPATQRQQLNDVNGINDQDSTDGSEVAADTIKSSYDSHNNEENRPLTQKGEDDTKEIEDAEKQTKMHNDFISALEKYGTSAEGAWKSMASDLNWTEEEVKVYAYSYFKSLVQDRKSKLYDKLFIKNDEAGQKDYENDRKKKKKRKADKRGNDKDKATSWSFHELVLLDSLMVKYCTDLNCLDVKNNNNSNKIAAADDADDEGSSSSAYWIRQRTVWEKIASQFPGKSAIQCKKVGFARLLKSYEERQKKKTSTV